MAIKIEGLKDLDAALQALAKSTSVRVARRGMAQALEPVADHARGLAPRSASNKKHMADTVGVSHKLTPAQAKGARGNDGPNEVSMFVGAKDPKAHLVEFGTGPRRHKSGKFVGVMPAQPFMRPAWDANREKVLETFAGFIAAEIEKTVARAAKRAAKLAAKRG
jgi:HK97 gp10 family phage protein